jgi:2-polyprenyl-6-methoxyphenol hydroxylase-like FAD-dependent oxidoreductase
VIGAGLGGLAAAAAVAAHFDRVIIVERDKLPDHPAPRPGVPQSAHLHALLAGGLEALMTLFPDFDKDLEAAGAVKSRVGLDQDLELPGFDPFPHHDIGSVLYTMSRPLLDFLVARRVLSVPNIRVQDRCRVTKIESSSERTGWSVRCENAGGHQESLPADLVIDASGRGALTLAVLDSLGYPLPEETSVGVDIQYATMTFASSRQTQNANVTITLPDGTSDTKSGCVVKIEGNKWMAVIGERHRPPPSARVEDFLDFAERLRTPTIYEIIRNAQPIDQVHRFSFPESRWRHFEHYPTFPNGILPIGDAICRFNPIYGQGMAVAAKEAVLLKGLLAVRQRSQYVTTGLAETFFAEAEPWIGAAWSASTTPDFVHPETRGERPPDFERSLRFMSAIYRIAARDAQVYRTLTLVRHLMALPTALHEPDLIRRVEAELAAE